MLDTWPSLSWKHHLSTNGQRSISKSTQKDPNKIPRSKQKPKRKERSTAWHPCVISVMCRHYGHCRNCLGLRLGRMNIRPINGGFNGKNNEHNLYTPAIMSGIFRVAMLDSPGMVDDFPATWPWCFFLVLERVPGKKTTWTSLNMIKHHWPSL